MSGQNTLQPPSPQPRVLTPVESQVSNELRIALLEEKLNGAYAFQNRLLALQALQASGLPLMFDGEARDVPNNKRLAISGDILLDWHLCVQWMQTDSSREEYSRRRNHIASNKNLDRVGRERGIDGCVIRRRDAVQSIGVEAMATTVEAVLGAVFQDAEEVKTGSGIEAVSKVASELGLDFFE